MMVGSCGRATTTGGDTGGSGSGGGGGGMCGVGTADDRGGRVVAPGQSRRGRPGRGCDGGVGASSRLIGDGRAGRSSRCALPTTAFLLTPSRTAICAVECPSSHS